jgi:hypothetical protein
LRERSVEVLRARRLDTLNVEMGLLGHASSDHPVVLLDRLEPMVADLAREAFSSASSGNAVDRVARELWREAILGRAGGAGLQRAAAQLERRGQLLTILRARLNDGRVQLAVPETWAFGVAFFAGLEPYSSRGAGRRPLLLARDRRNLRRADAALLAGEGREALSLALELEARATEAHEARHALEPGEFEIPAKLLALAGADNLAFAHSAEHELRAYVGELVDADAPPCLSLARIAVNAAGGTPARPRTTTQALRCFASSTKASAPSPPRACGGSAGCPPTSLGPQWPPRTTGFVAGRLLRRAERSLEAAPPGAAL